MGLKEDILEMKNEVNNIKEQSLAMELYQDSKRANKRICWSFTIVLVIMIVAYFITVALFLHNYNDTAYEETITNTKTQEIEDIDSMQNSNIINGDVYGQNKAN